MDVHDEGGRQWLVALLAAMALAGLFFAISSLTDSEDGSGGFVEAVNWVSWFGFVLFAGAVIMIGFGGLIRLAGWAWGRARGAPVHDE